MTFGEQFPSLMKNRMIFHKPKGSLNEWFIDNEIKEHCLDKQKVKEAIDKFYYSFNKTDTSFENMFTKLKKELGLGGK